ncbi:MAG: nucleoside-diphosphate kinase [Patescibacteria group bacterium]|jgi:nucleoside-diphosphate kinase
MQDMIERTFAMIKPDGVARGLTGQIITDFERSGLKLVGLKMLLPERSLVEKHYSGDNAWIANLGQRTMDGCIELGMDLAKEYGTTDTLELGKQIKEWLIDYICSGPVVAMVWEGMVAVSNVRRLCGNTIPNKAEPGSIRGKYGLDSAISANSQKRPVFNIIHASGNAEEAATEIKLWFPELVK